MGEVRGCAADYDQDLHRDYLNHTILVSPSTPAFRQLELFVFLCDVTVELVAQRYPGLDLSPWESAAPAG